MLKNRFFSLFALAAIAGLAACDTEPAEETPAIEPAVEAEAVVAEPVAPISADTVGVVPTEVAPVAVDTNPAMPAAEPAPAQP